MGSESLLGRRFLTLNSIIRVRQVERTRTEAHGSEEYDRHTPENVLAMREAFAAGWPGGRMTWAWSWLALHDQRPQYRAVRALMPEFNQRYGDDVTLNPSGFFPNRYNSRAQVSRDLHDGLARVSEMMGGSFRPKSVVSGFMAAENLRYLAENEGIHVCQGNIFSQFAIDDQDGDGSVAYPYYPSTEHFCKPAQGPADFIDCVNLDGWTVDFVAARGVQGWLQQSPGRGSDRDAGRPRLGDGPSPDAGHDGRAL